MVRATEDHAELLGSRVLAVHGVPPERLRREIASYVSGTDSWVTYMSTYYLDTSDFLSGIGVVADPDSVPMGFQLPGGDPFQCTLAPLPPEERRSPYEAWRDLSPTATGNGDGRRWLHVLPAEGSPLYLLRPNRAWSYEYLEGDKTLYIQLTRNTGDENASQEKLAATLEALADSIAPAAVVFDVRFNTGGDFTQTGTITKEIPRWFRSARHVYIVTGPPTFLAGIVSAARLKHFSAGKALVLGEPAGDGLTMWSEGPTCTLPNSKLRVKAATAFHDFETGREPGKRA